MERVNERQSELSGQCLTSFRLRNHMRHWLF